MPLAASVRLICSVISSSEGIWVEGQRPGRGAQPGQVLVQPEDPPVVQPEPLPDRVAALDGRVERAHRGVVAVGEPAAHVDDQVAVALIEDLKHEDLPGRDAIAVQAVEVGQALVREGSRRAGSGAAGGR